MVQWLRLCVSIIGGRGLILGWGIKISYSTRSSPHPCPNTVIYSHLHTSFHINRFLKVGLLSQRIHLIHKVKLLSKRLCQNTLSNGFLSYFNENIEIFIRIALDLQINFRKIGILTLLNLPL